MRKQISSYTHLGYLPRTAIRVLLLFLDHILFEPDRAIVLFLFTVHRKQDSSCVGHVTAHLRLRKLVSSWPIVSCGCLRPCRSKAPPAGLFTCTLTSHGAMVVTMPVESCIQHRQSIWRLDLPASCLQSHHNDTAGTGTRIRRSPVAHQSAGLSADHYRCCGEQRYHPDNLCRHVWHRTVIRTGEPCSLIASRRCEFAKMRPRCRGRV